MARIRSIHPDSCRSELLAACTAEQERCFWRLLPQCDDEGRCEDAPKVLAAFMFPMNEEIVGADVDGWLGRLARLGLIVRYEVDGRRYLAVDANEWNDHQHPQRPTPSKFPAPPAPSIDTDEDCSKEHEPSPILRESSASPHEQVESAQEDSCPEVGEGVGDGEGVGEERDAFELVPLALTSPAQAPTRLVFDAWLESTKKNPLRTNFDAKRQRVIRQALKSYPLEDVLDAVRGWRHSPFHCGQNDARKVYNEIELLLRDSAQIEKFRDLERGHEDGPLKPVMTKGFDSIERAVAAAANGSTNPRSLNR